MTNDPNPLSDAEVDALEKKLINEPIEMPVEDLDLMLHLIRDWRGKDRVLTDEEVSQLKLFRTGFLVVFILAFVLFILMTVFVMVDGSWTSVGFGLAGLMLILLFVIMVKMMPQLKPGTPKKPTP